MKSRWWPHFHKETDPEDHDVHREDRMRAARAARQAGREALRQAYSQFPEVEELSDTLRALRTQNHFSEQVRTMLQAAVVPPPQPRRR
jgi:hypothetical protein